jgi:hypothetical protein
MKSLPDCDSIAVHAMLDEPTTIEVECPECGLHVVRASNGQWIPANDRTDDPPFDDGDSRLRQWWTDSAFDEADRTIAKKERYGSLDLVELGQALRRMSARPRLDDPCEAMELGCLMYLLGKIERAIENVARGNPIDSDHWFDIHVYAKMAQAARAGVWEIQ